MKPIPNFGLRVGVLIALLVPLYFTSAGWVVKLFVVVWMAGLVGTVWWSDIREAKLERQLFVAFVPLRKKRWSLDKFQRIETQYAPQTPGWSIIGLGALWFLWQAFDWLFPWLGGAYQLYLRGNSGKRVVVWQGNSDACFEENLARLIEATGFPVQRK